MAAKKRTQRETSFIVLYCSDEKCFLLIFPQNPAESFSEARKQNDVITRFGADRQIFATENFVQIRAEFSVG